MRILNIVPCNADVFTPNMEAYLRTHLGEETVIESVRLQEGKPSIEGEYDEMVNTPHVVELAIRGEKNGCDAVFINCFGDPGVRAARECVDIPVFGGFEPAVLLALGLGDRIGIVTVVPNVVPLIRRNVAAAQLDGRIVTARNVGIPVLALKSTGDLSAAIAAEAKKAVVENNVEVIVLGCTGMVDVAEEVKRLLKDDGFDIPVIEAAKSAVMMLELYVKMGLKHSRLTYLPPAEK